MDAPLAASSPLAALAELYRGRRSGLLSIDAPGSPLRVLLREGQIVGLGPADGSTPASSPPGPDDSARLRLEQVLREVGIRRVSTPPNPRPVPSAGALRERLLGALVDDSLSVSFDDDARGGADLRETAGGTEPLLLEAVHRLADRQEVRRALGDLDQRLVAATSLADERTLTLTEGYLLSRIDGNASAREVLQLVPLAPAETERTLLGLVLTGRVEYRAALRAVLSPVPAAARAVPEEAAEDERAEEDPPVRSDEASEAPVPEERPPSPPEVPPAPPGVEKDPATLERRREILEVFQALPLKNHFEVLGVAPGCTDAEVKKAYVTHAKRYHPDVHRDPRLADLHDVLEAIFIRVGEAWEVLGDARSRASYEARYTVARRGTSGQTTESGGGRPRPGAGAATLPDYVPPEETLLKAQALLSQARYWDAIQMLEAAVPHMPGVIQQNRGRILLARALAKNPNWLRRAEETLQDVVRLDPANADAHFELGLIYKASGLPARAQTQFRRVVELRPDHREAASELPPAPPPAGGGLLKRLFGRGKAS